MYAASRKEWLTLAIGDLLFLGLSLWLTLSVRYFEFPSQELFVNHLVPFSLLAVVWLLVFIIFGLYEKHTTRFKLILPGRILQAQTGNIIIAAIFFFMIPYFGITPKTNLVIYLIISSALIIVWRLFVFPLFGASKKTKALMIGSGREMEELVEEINKNSRYDLHFVATFDLKRSGNPNDLQQEVLKVIASEKVSVVVANMHDKDLELIAPLLYNLSFVQTKVETLDLAELYEDVFERVPIGLISYEWFVEHIATKKHLLYEVFKRVVDVVGASIIGLVSLLMYPIVWLVIKLDDGGPLYVVQERVGQGQLPIKIIKFRTMTGTSSDEGEEVLQSKKQVTKVGQLLRDARIDEFPQLWSVFLGRQSLIGPRPELPALAELYGEKIPHYRARYIVKPGLSGWAQIHHQEHPHHGTDIQETKTKLAYDLYYIKHRSVFLDILIALRTIQIILSRVGR